MNVITNVNCSFYADFLLSRIDDSIFIHSLFLLSLNKIVIINHSILSKIRLKSEWHSIAFCEQ